MSAGSTTAVADRVFGAVLGAMDVFAIVIGDRLGYYRCLAEQDALSSVELAAATGTAERYAREWLEQQAVTGLLTAAEPEAAGPRRFALASGVSEVLVEADGLAYLAPLARQVSAAGRQLPAIIDAFRTGRGVPWSAHGADMRESQADLNRPGFIGLLGSDWIPAMPEVHARLRAEPRARVADVGTGAGWSAIALAQAFPLVHVDAFDIDAPTVELARANIEAAGLSDRVRVVATDITGCARADYDLVMAFECIHDLPRPVEVLSAMKRLAGEAGTVLVVDEKVADRFEAPGDDVERLMYGFSLLVCLADGLSAQPSAATGTVMRAPTLRGYARDAGFIDVEVLPVEHDTWRFYRLR